MNRTEYAYISKRAKTLLQKEEGFDVEFKESVNSVDSEDVVAFANSENSGTILIGVKELVNKGGRQIGQIIGCSVGDREKQRILSKAQSCVPPVKIDVYAENIKRKPFYRIEIPSGKEKPYCTSRGVYKIRDDGRNKAILPGTLLSMFMERETRQFMARFRAATEALEKDLDEIGKRLVSELEYIGFSVSGMEQKIDESLEGIYHNAEEARGFSEESLGYASESYGGIQEVDDKVEMVRSDLNDIELKINAILTHLDIEDPLITRAKSLAKGICRHFLESHHDISKEELMDVLRGGMPGLDERLRDEWCDEVLAEVREGKPPQVQ